MRQWLILLMVGLGCSDSRLSDSVEAPGITVTTETDRPSVAAGETLRITVTATNVSGSSRTLQFASQCLTSFEFLDASGNVVARAQPLCLQTLTQRTLAAGGTLVDSHTWTRGSIDPPQVAPGTYRIRGVLLATGDTVRSASIPVSLP